MAEVLYDDGSLRITDHDVVVRRYYFPWGGDRRIALSDITALHAAPAGWLVRYRLWGTHRLDTWFPFDIRRPSRRTAVTFAVDGRVHPACTPRDADRVLRLLQPRIGGRPPGAR